MAKINGLEVDYCAMVFRVLKPYNYIKMGLRYVKATVGVKPESYYVGDDQLEIGSLISLYGLNEIAQDNNSPEYQKYVSLAKGGKKPTYRWLEEFTERLISEGFLASNTLNVAAISGCRSASS